MYQDILVRGKADWLSLTLFPAKRKAIYDKTNLITNVIKQIR